MTHCHGHKGDIPVGDTHMGFEGHSPPTHASSKESGTRVKVHRSHKTGHTENWVSSGGWAVSETQSNKGKFP